MKLALLLLFVLLTGCGSNLDIFGVGQKAKCLYVDIDSMKIINTCNDTTMDFISISNWSLDSNATIFQKNFKDKGVWSLDLPFTRDSLLKNDYHFYISLSDFRWRETMTINTSPKSWKKGKRRVYARYTLH